MDIILREKDMLVAHKNGINMAGKWFMMHKDG
ncbi:hypothetical protein BH11BAC5_BH11BAC5_54690 [soil metagenome]